MEGVRKFLIITQVTDHSNLHTTGDSNTNILQFLHEKLILLLHFISGIFTYLPEKFDEIFPPETQSDTLHYWMHILLTVIPPASLAICVLWCCFCCFRRRGARGRMMRAPGRDGDVMPREDFEENPRDYFINLRAGKPLGY